jgi:hypothetical protein
MAPVFLGTVYNRTILSEPYNASQSERKAKDVLRQTLETEGVSR